MLTIENPEQERRIFRNLLTLLIRVALLLALVVKCYSIFSPFLNLMLWALIMAVTMFPMHQKLAAKFKGRQGLASTFMVLAGIGLVVVPTAFLLNSLADSLSWLLESVRTNTLHIPQPPESIGAWPVVGDKISTLWGQAATDLPGFVQGMQPKIGDLAKAAVAIVSSMGGGLLQFLASYVIAGLLLPHGAAGYEQALAIARKLAGRERGQHFTDLCTATVRAVARGVIGVAFIQALLVGLFLTVAGVPAAGFLALVTLVLGIAQAPAALVTLPAIGYIWMVGDYSSGAATVYSLLLFVAGLADNVLKPMLLGRGVKAPMPVILLGALGGMVSSGILGLFVGSTMLTLGYQIFLDWVHHYQSDES